MTTEREQIELRRAVIRARLHGAFTDLREAGLAPLDVRPIIRRRPWWSLGAGLVAGFLSVLGLDRALRGRSVRARGTSKPSAAGRGQREPERSLFARVQDHAFRVMKRVATIAIVATLRDRSRAELDPGAFLVDEPVATGSLAPRATRRNGAARVGADVDL